MKNVSHRFYYGWVIVAVSFFTLFMAIGIRSSFGIFYVAILNEYGWGRAETAGAFSALMFVHGLFAPVSGYLIDRLGPRILFPLGSIWLVAGLVAASRINAVWHLYLCFGVLIAIGVNTLSFSPHMSLIPKWFIREMGLASGLVLSGAGMGIMVMAPFIAVMINTVGWHNAFLILAGIVFGVVFPMTALFHRRSPEDVGQSTGEEVSGTNLTHPAQGLHLPVQWTLKRACFTRSFWWAGLIFFSHGFLINMLVVHQAIYVVDKGYSPLLAASLVGLVGLLGSAGGILFGFFSDRAGREVSFTAGTGAAFLGVLLLLLLKDNASIWMLYAFAILYGLGVGGMNPTTATTIGDLFPGNSLGRILSIMTMKFGFGGALGAFVGGYYYDKMGSYFIPFLLLLVSIVIGNIAIWMAAPRVRRRL